MQKSTYYFRTKNTLKRILNGLHKVDAKEEDSIVIMSTRRSGSTLLMETVYSQPNFGYVNEPFKFWKPHKYSALLPNCKEMRYKNLSKKEIHKIANFHKKICSGNLRFRGQWNFLSSSYSRNVNRFVFKEFNTKPVMYKLNEELSSQMIYLVRHPVSSALSIMDRGWDDSLDVFVDRSYLEGYLDRDAIRFCESVSDSGNQFARHVLQWCLENLHPLRLHPERTIPLLTYEELVARPHRVSDWLADLFELPLPERMANCIHRPSNTVRSKSKDKLRNHSPEGLATRRFTELSQRERKVTAEILDALSITIYDAASPAPASWAIQLGELQFEGARDS